ncbi:MAG: zf-HC2 domain-containing protein, partial [Clostridiaceae bacterium]|nr:zf-HC2 domain-containing protein [Clostridiaceae bacterium]
MKCETIRNMMSSYIDKDLNNIEKTEFEKHLSECEECREEYESLFDIITSCGNLEEIELPQNFRTELHQRLNEANKKKNFFSGIMGSKRMKMATGLVAAALVIAIGIGGSSVLFDNNMKMTQESAPDPGYGVASAPAASPEYFDADLSMNKAKRSEER